MQFATSDAFFVLYLDGPDEKLEMLPIDPSLDPPDLEFGLVGV